MTMIIEELDWEIAADEWADAPPKCPRKASEELSALVEEYLTNGGTITVLEPVRSHDFSYRETTNAIFGGHGWSITDTFTLAERTAHHKRKTDRLKSNQMATDKVDVPLVNAALDLEFPNRWALVKHLGMSNDKVVRLLRLYFENDPRAEPFQRVDRDTKKADQDAKFLARIKVEYAKGDVPNKTALRKRIGGGITEETLNRLLRSHFPNHPITVAMRDWRKPWSPTWLDRMTKKAQKLLDEGRNGRKALSDALGLDHSDEVDRFLELTGLPFVHQRKVALRGTTS